MTENSPENKGYDGDDAADYGNPADERDVQAAPTSGGNVAANEGTQFAPDTDDDDDSPQSSTSTTSESSTGSGY